MTTNIILQIFNWAGKVEFFRYTVTWYQTRAISKWRIPPNTKLTHHWFQAVSDIIASYWITSNLNRFDWNLPFLNYACDQKLQWGDVQMNIIMDVWFTITFRTEMNNKNRRVKEIQSNITWGFKCQKSKRTDIFLAPRKVKRGMNVSLQVGQSKFEIKQYKRHAETAFLRYACEVEV